MKRTVVVDGLLLLGVVLWLYWIMAVVPVAQEAAGAWAQKIFYVHVPSAMVSFLGFLLAALMSLGVLFGDEYHWDRMLVPTVEVSYVFTTLVLLTGPLWARPVWGIWWRWEPRLTSFFVLWLTYSGWFLFRTVLPPGSRQRTYSAIYALVASLNIVIVAVSVYLWQPEMQLHPTDIQLDPAMQQARFVSMALMFLLMARLLWLRVDRERHRRRKRGIPLEKP